MIISHKYKFIYIKNQRVASTSMEIALSKFCGPDDIITPISRHKERRRTELGYMPPQNYQDPDNPEESLFIHHMPAEEIQKRIPESVWQSYFKFCIERNPWDKLVSIYYHKQGKNASSEPNEVRKALRQHVEAGNKISNWRTYAINNKIAVDYVALYETLYQELPIIQECIGLPEPIPLGDIWVSRGKRLFAENYRLVFNDDLRDRVAQECRNEIEQFGYKF